MDCSYLPSGSTKLGHRRRRMQDPVVGDVEEQGLSDPQNGFSYDCTGRRGQLAPTHDSVSRDCTGHDGQSAPRHSRVSRDSMGYMGQEESLSGKQNCFSEDHTQYAADGRPPFFRLDKRLEKHMERLAGAKQESAKKAALATAGTER